MKLNISRRITRMREALRSFELPPSPLMLPDSMFPMPPLPPLPRPPSLAQIEEQVRFRMRQLDRMERQLNVFDSSLDSPFPFRPGGAAQMATQQIMDATPPGGGHAGSPYRYKAEVFEQLLKESELWWAGVGEMADTHRRPVQAALRIAAEIARIADRVDVALRTNNRQ